MAQKRKRGWLALKEAFLYWGQMGSAGRFKLETFGLSCTMGHFRDKHKLSRKKVKRKKILLLLVSLTKENEEDHGRVEISS